MKFRPLFHLGKLIFLSAAYGFIVYALFFKGTKGLPPIVITAAYLYLSCIVAIISVALKLTVWRTGLEHIGDNLLVVTFLGRYLVPISEIGKYEIRDYINNEHKIILQTKYKYYTIYPEALVGGLKECKALLSSLGLQEDDNSGPQKHYKRARRLSEK